jgi:hypothetical protein
LRNKVIRSNDCHPPDKAVVATLEQGSYPLMLGIKILGIGIDEVRDISSNTFFQHLSQKQVKMVRHQAIRDYLD